MTQPPWDHYQANWWPGSQPRPQPSWPGGDPLSDIRERLARIETTGQHIHHDVRTLSRGHYELDIRTRDLDGRVSRMEAKVQRRLKQSQPPPERRTLPGATPDQIRSILHYTIAALVLLLVLLGKISGADALGAVLKIFGLG